MTPRRTFRLLATQSFAFLEHVAEVLIHLERIAPDADYLFDDLADHGCTHLHLKQCISQKIRDFLVCFLVPLYPGDFICQLFVSHHSGVLLFFALRRLSESGFVGVEVVAFVHVCLICVFFVIQCFLLVWLAIIRVQVAILGLTPYGRFG